MSSTVGAASIAAALGQGTAVTVALAASVALNSISGNVSATVKDAQVTTRNGDITIAATRTGTISTTAAAASVAVGVSGDKGIGVSGAGAAAVNKINSSTTAIGQNAALNAAGAVTVSAGSTATIKADIISAAASVGAGSGSSGAGALGIAIAYNEIGAWTAYDEAGNTLSQTPTLGNRANVSATLSNTPVSATGALAVTATSRNTITANIVAIAAGAALSGSNAGAVSVGGTFAMNNIGLATGALIDGDGTGTGPGIAAASATVSASDASTITAKALSASLALAAGASNAVSVAVGGSVGLNSIANDVSATVKNVDRGLQTTGAILVSAKSAGAITAHAASAALSIAGGGSNAVAVSAAVTYARNVITTGTRASVVDSAFVTTGGSGTIDVKAESSAAIEAKILAAALAVGVGGSNGVGVGIGAAIAENYIGSWDKTVEKDAAGKEKTETTAYTLKGAGGTAVAALVSNTGVSASKALSVTATSAQTITAQVVAASAAIGGGGTAGVGASAAGAVVSNAIAVATSATISGSGTTGINAGGVVVNAADTSTIDALAGS
ncbi:beta strand repeat-containing protein, partial [Methylobacterium haplocladii]|uniref:beta strand repeat-containing protein n=1 Tax=Methylobacterium haplocladii TaxID=1176176 RepID=UPI0024E17207